MRPIRPRKSTPKTEKPRIARYTAIIAKYRLVALSLMIVFGLPSRGADIVSFQRLDRQALERIRHPLLGLPKVPLPTDNPPTSDKIRLGRKLFADPRLSEDGKLSCATCHIPGQGFTSSEPGPAVGRGGKTLRRNAPSVVNAVYMAPFFHDGRQPELDQQPIDVLLNPDEFSMPSTEFAVRRLQGLAEYISLFKVAYGESVTAENIGQAIATYVRTLLSGNSAFDQFYFEGIHLDESADNGFWIFTGEGRCSSCHTIAKSHALFTDRRFHDTGVAWRNYMIRRGRVVGARNNRKTAQREDDLGRYEVTGDVSDRWRIKTPGLRNVALTAPYMHDGSLNTLREVVEFYNKGGHPHPEQDSLVQPLHLSEQQIEDLVAFLRSLTGSNVHELTSDALSVAAVSAGEIRNANGIVSDQD